jgi:hypothetical protein
MMSERMERRKSRAGNAAAAPGTKGADTALWFRSANSGIPDINTLVIVATEGNVPDTGRRNRLTSGHAPFFSLFTFFANRQ